MTTNESRLNEVLDDSTFAEVLNPANYVNPTSWMREHLKTHPDYLDSSSGAVMSLPYIFELSSTGIGYVGRCTCTICKETHSITNIDKF